MCMEAFPCRTNNYNKVTKRAQSLCATSLKLSSFIAANVYVVVVVNHIRSEAEEDDHSDQHSDQEMSRETLANIITLLLRIVAWDKPEMMVAACFEVLSYSPPLRLPILTELLEAPVL